VPGSVPLVFGRTQRKIIRATRRESIELADTIRSAKEAAARLNKRVGRFEIYSFLKSIYRVYMRWKDRRVARRSARLMAQDLSITRRKGASPMRVTIEATFPRADLRQKSRWSLKARSSKSVRNRLGEMKMNKLIHGDAAKGYRLTTAGHAEAVAEIKQINANPVEGRISSMAS
jgi:hypothetical protein